MRTPAFQLEHAERVDGAGAVVLVHVAGTWTAAAEVELGAPLLEVRLDAGPRRFSALPDLPARLPRATPSGRAFRGAFPLPRAVADAARGASLVLTGADAVPLPGLLGDDAPPPPGALEAARQALEAQRLLLQAEVEAADAARREVALLKTIVAAERAAREEAGHARDAARREAEEARGAAVDRTELEAVEAERDSAIAASATAPGRLADAERDGALAETGTEGERDGALARLSEIEARGANPDVAQLERERDGALALAADAEQRAADAEAALQAVCAERDSAVAAAAANAVARAGDSEGPDLADRLAAAERERDAARAEAAAAAGHRDEEVTRLRAALADAEQEIADLAGRLDRARRARDGARSASPGDAPLAVRIRELEQALESADGRTEHVSRELAATRRELDEAVERLHEEAEARDRAEAGARGAAPARGDADGDPGSGARINTLEDALAEARAHVDRLTEEVIANRRELELAAERLRDETEARMRAEARAASAAGDLR